MRSPWDARLQFEAVPESPRVVLSPSTVYFTWLPGPPAFLAAVRFCGVGLNGAGCFSTLLGKLPLASEAVPTTVPLMPSTLIFADTIRVAGPDAGKLYFMVEVPTVP